MPSTISTLRAIKSLVPITWSRFVRELPDRPHAYVDREAWREILQTVGALADMELIIVVRDKTSNEIQSLALTELGVERLRESNESDRLAILRKQNRVEKDRRRYA
jgi:hypothetical protein